MDGDLRPAGYESAGLRKASSSAERVNRGLCEPPRVTSCRGVTPSDRQFLERFLAVSQIMSIDLGAKPVGSTASAHLRLVVIGATGGIGRAVIDQAKQRGHDVTALVRTPEKLGSLAQRVHVIRGDPLDTEVVKRAIGGHDAVLSALGPPGLGHSTVQQDGARSVVAAMQSVSMKRLVIVSAALLFRDAGVLAAILRNTLLRDVARDCAAAERIVIGTDLEWTIARPPRLDRKSVV